MFILYIANVNDEKLKFHEWPPFLAIIGYTLTIWQKFLAISFI